MPFVEILACNLANISLGIFEPVIAFQPVERPPKTPPITRVPAPANAAANPASSKARSIETLFKLRSSFCFSLTAASRSASSKEVSASIFSI